MKILNWFSRPKNKVKTYRNFSDLKEGSVVFIKDNYERKIRVGFVTELHDTELSARIPSMDNEIIKAVKINHDWVISR